MSVNNRGPVEVIVIDDECVSATPPLPSSAPLTSGINLENEIEVIDMAAASDITLIMPSWGETEECVSDDMLPTIGTCNEVVEDAVKDLLDSMLAELEDDGSEAYRLVACQNSSVNVDDDDLEVCDVPSESSEAISTLEVDNSIRESCIVYVNPEEITPDEVSTECAEVLESTCGDSVTEDSNYMYVSFEIADDENVSGKSESVCKGDVLFARVDSQDRTIVDLKAKIRQLESALEDRDRQLVKLNSSCKNVGHLETTIKELEERLQTFSDDKKDLLLKLREAGAKLSPQGDEDHSTRLAAELADALKVADDLRASLRDKDARIAMLEIDVEYARDEAKAVTDKLSSAKDTCRKEQESVNEELSREKEINANLRYDLKEEMKERIRELKMLTESEKEVLVKQVASLKEQEVDYLRKLHDLRTNYENQVSQMRDLRADVKAKGMESEAYRDVAERLKQVVTRLEKENARLQQTVNHMLIEQKKNGVTFGPEVITIDTDDAESSDEDGYLKRSADARGSPSAKRSRSPVQVGDGPKRPKTAIPLMEETAPTKDLVVKRVAEISTQYNFTTDVEDSLRSRVEELDAKLQKLTADNDSLVNELMSLREKVETEAPREEGKCSGRVQEEQSKGLSPGCALISSLNVDLIVAARDRLETLLSSVSKELLAEKAKVETLESRLRLSASTKEKALTDQQTRLKEIQQCLTMLEAKLEQGRAYIMVVKEENRQLADEGDKEGQSFKDLGERCDAINGTLEAVLQERDRLQKEVTILEAGQVGLQKLRDRNATLENDLATAMTEHDRLSGLLKELEERSKKVEALEQSVLELKASIEVAHQQRCDLVSQLAKRQQEVDTIMDACKQTIALADEERKAVLHQCQASVDASERTADGLRAQVADISHANERLHDQLEVFRAKVNNAERQLSEKEAVIALLRSELSEFQVQQESAKVRLNTLSEEVISTKERLARTERMLKDASNAAELLERRVNEEKAEATQKHRFFENVREKLASIEAEVTDALNGRKDVREKLSELKGIVGEDCDEPVISKALHDELAEFRRTLDQRKCELKAIETDVLRDVTHLAVLEKCNLESSKERDRLCTEFGRVREELKTANAVSEDLRTELKSLREENVTLAAKARSVKVLANRVEGVGTAVAKLNLGVSQLEMGLLEDESAQEKATEALGSDLDDVQSRLSKLKETAEALSLGALGSQPEKASVSEEKSSSSIHANVVSSLMEQANVLKSNNEALQSRLSMALANGRRMETLLQNLQQSSRVPTTSKLDLQTAQNERDDLIAKLAESGDLGRRLQAKVIHLTKIIRQLQGKPCEPHDVYVINLDDCERVADDRDVVSATVRAKSDLAEKSPGLKQKAKSAEDVRDKVLLPSRLIQQVDITKQNEIGKRPRLSEQPQSVTSEKHSTHCQSGAVQIKKLPISTDPDLITERTVSKKPHMFDNERALSTITNSIHHSSVVAQDQPTLVHPRSTVSKSTEACQVQ